MSWEKSIEELRRREALAEELGGADKVARQREHGKLTIRERITKLIDADTFHEIGAIAGKAQYDDEGEMTDFTASNFVFGRGKVDGRRVIVGGDDFTVRGGSSDASIMEKRLAAERMAYENRLPIIRLVEGSGGGGSVKMVEDMGYSLLPGNLEILSWLTKNLSMVPVTSLALGSVAGMGAGQVAASHYSLIVKDIAAMFVAGPPLVARIGENVTRQELGGSDIHTSNGVIDDAVETEEEAFQRTRQFLSYLPSSVYELPPRGQTYDDPERRDEWLIEAVPENRRRVFKMHPIIKTVVDQDSFFEIGGNWGRSLITGLARLDGWPMMVLANDSMHDAGGWTAQACRKAARAVDLAQTFHLPIVYLVDCPGFVIGTKSEQEGTVREGMRAVAAIEQSTVPWCTIIVRRAFGLAGAANSPAERLGHRYGWPSGNWGPLPIEGGIEAAYRAQLEAADDYDAELAKIEARLDKIRSPYRTAEAFGIEEIIDPRDTRPLLCEFANTVASLRTAGPPSMGARP
ncbi:MAG: methylmalonyl-CoA carboxyltransferase [Rhodospirillaceae bacterium]|nr:methylmalonyl-CoA carboxyltransferase [Rhodospirillaceae bacterium]